MRKKMLARYQDKEDAIKWLYNTNALQETKPDPEFITSDVVTQFLDHRKILDELRKKNGGKQGIAPKIFQYELEGLRIFSDYCSANSLILTKDVTSQAINDFKRYIQLLDHAIPTKN